MILCHFYLLCPSFSLIHIVLYILDINKHTLLKRTMCTNERVMWCFRFSKVRMWGIYRGKSHLFCKREKLRQPPESCRPSGLDNPHAKQKTTTLWWDTHTHIPPYFASPSHMSCFQFPSAPRQLLSSRHLTLDKDSVHAYCFLLFSFKIQVPSK
jgi:hypothetical protein